MPVVPTAHMIAATTNDDQGAKGLRAKIAVDAYKSMLAAAPTPPQPIYDETSDRVLVEKIISKRGWPTEKVNGFYADYRAHHAWSVCMEFSQARAKSVEVGHE